MGFDGAGIYAIVPYRSPDVSMNLWGGGMEKGGDVRTYDRGDRQNPSDNALWQVAHVKGSGDNAEYVILNVRNGYYLYAAGKQSIIKCDQVSPRDARARWKIVKKMSHQYETYVVNCVASDYGQLNVKGAKLGSGVDIIAWQIEDGDNTKWYFDKY